MLDKKWIMFIVYGSNNFEYVYKCINARYIKMSCLVVVLKWHLSIVKWDSLLQKRFWYEYWFDLSDSTSHNTWTLTVAVEDKNATKQYFVIIDKLRYPIDLTIHSNYLLTGQLISFDKKLNLEVRLQILYHRSCLPRRLTRDSRSR